MSEPIRLSRSAPTRHEWEPMQELLQRHRHDHLRLEGLVEDRVADIVKRPFSVAFSTTGAAVTAAIRALGVERRNVLLPAFCPAPLAWSTRSWANPQLADIDPKTLNLSVPHAAELLNAFQRREDASPGDASSIRAVLACTTHGNAAGLAELAALASRNEIPLLEFVGGGLGGTLGADPVGRFGRISVIALGENESTIGSGGAVCVTNDDNLASSLRLQRGDGCADPRSEWERLGGIRRFEAPGLDARMSALQAALAAVRLESFTELCDRLDAVFHSYLRRLATHPDLVLPAPCSDGTVRWSHFAIRLSERFTREDRDAIVQGLLRHDIAATVHMHALHLEPGWHGGTPTSAHPIAERCSSRMIELPFSALVGERDIDLVCQTLQVMIERASIMRS
ncbi:MAG: DegT/DnrJ/EryC1/StrS family aminotransferase [Planctomycetaceae bacterium]|nr:DegT/DnrJ/EryC1/StrS family aminotransferase [Planctomycetaceae bacterium]